MDSAGNSTSQSPFVKDGATGATASGRAPISQNWLNEYGRTHPGFRVPNLHSHSFLDPYDTPEGNFKRLQKAVADRKREGQKWEDHEWAPENYSLLHPWPFNIPLHERPQPSSYCPGPGKPVNTLKGKCLSCTRYIRKCYDGITRGGACTTCQGSRYIRAYLDGEERGGSPPEKPSTATGKVRVCYWPQREFFLNDHDSAKLFHSDAWYNNKNTRKGKEERAQRARALSEDEAGDGAAADVLQQQPRSQSLDSQTAETPALARAITLSYDADVSSWPTRPIAFDTAQSIGLAVNGQTSGSHFTTDRQCLSMSGFSEPDLNSRGTKRGRTDGLEDLEVSAKRARTGDGPSLSQSPTDQPHAHVTTGPVTTRRGPEGARERGNGDGQTSAEQRRPENMSIQLGLLPLSQTPDGTYTVNLGDVPSSDDVTVNALYRRLLDQIAHFTRTGDIWQVAGVQAVLNVAGNDRARALHLLRVRDEQVLAERDRLIARQSGITHTLMVVRLGSIQAQYISNGNVPAKSRNDALRLQAALNITHNAEYAAPAHYFGRDPLVDREAERIAGEHHRGPYGAHRPLSAQERLIILFRASDVRNQAVRSQILAQLQPFGLDLDNFRTMGNEDVLPDHVARVIEYMVATMPRI